jgi:hypothetical protein
MLPAARPFAAALRAPLAESPKIIDTMKAVPRSGAGSTFLNEEMRP